jgi:hypothetical protein
MRLDKLKPVKMYEKVNTKTRIVFVDNQGEVITVTDGVN